MRLHTTLPDRIFPVPAVASLLRIAVGVAAAFALAASGAALLAASDRDAAAEMASDLNLRASSDSGPWPIEVGDYDVIIPHVVDGASWQTSFLLTNLGATTVYFAVRFRDDSGGALSLTLAGFGPAFGVNGRLDPNQSAEFKTAGTGSTLAQGSAIVFTLDRPGDDPSARPLPNQLGGYAIFRQRIQGRPDSEAVVPVSPMFESSFTLFFDNRDGYITGAALVNIGSQTSPVTVVARDFMGTQLLTDSFDLAPMSKRVFSIPDRYPALNGRIGILQISTTNLTLSGLALRFTPGGAAFTSSHVLSYPK
ncbi:MAG: hypothetical protein IT158_25545 [Bryobacterales bacterium]|nr:hypothetical protein [Bryobacterales bacterium]